MKINPGSGTQAMSVDVLSQEEEETLQFIEERWNKEKPKKVNFKDISEQFLSKKFGYTSDEKARQLAYSLYRKGQILIDIKGRERLCRPNHVTVYSRNHPKDFRNITIIDEETEYPLSRVWFSIFMESDKPFLNITESKKTKLGWETVNNIMVPPDAIEAFLAMSEYINDKIKELQPKEAKKK